MSESTRPIDHFGKFLPSTGGTSLIRRDAELDLLLRYLRSSRPSVLIIGPSGCGKTALIEAAAQKINRPILETATGQMLVGTRYLGEFETRLKEFVDTCSKEHAIVYYTDMWSLQQTGRSSSSDKSVGTFMAPYMARGEMALLGECTDEQYRTAVNDDPKFATLFQIIRLHESSDADSAEILTAAAAQRISKMVTAHGIEIVISETVKRRIIEESRLAFAAIAAPGRTIRLLDAVISEELEPSLALLVEERPEQVVVRPEIVIRVVEKLTGMSHRLLDEAQPLRADEVRQWLETRVLGQADAIKAVVDLVMLIKSGMTRPERPVGVMMFVGPTGVGKTELAKRLAEYVFGSDSRLIRFDMGEFQDASAVQRLAGSPWSNDPATREGLLTAKVRNQPFSVVLLDEIEKANRSVHQMLLGVFGSGRLTDPQGRTTDFSRSIIIMTSNLGSDLTRTGSTGFGLKPMEFRLEENIDEAMGSFFSPEFRGRITRHVLFQPLQLPQLRILAQREIGKMLLERGIRRRNVHLEIDASVYDLVLSKVTTDPLGARVMSARVDEMVVTPLSYRLAELTPSENGNIVRMSAKKGAVVVSVIKPAEDPRTSAAPSKAQVRSVRISVSGTNKPVKLTRKSLTGLLADVQGQDNHLTDLCQQYRLDERKSELLANTMRQDFWDDPQAASTIHTEIHRIDSTLAMVDGISAELNQLLYLNRDSALSAGAMEAIGRRAMKLQNRIVLARYVLHFQGPIDRCHSFIDVRLIGQETLKIDPAGRIAGMYTAWAKTRDLPVKILHEEITDGITRHAILLIEGVATTGILAGEQGLHELHVGHQNRQRAASAFVDVKILPRLDESPRLPITKITATKSRGKGKLVHVYRSELRIDCPEIGVKLPLRGELEMDKAKELAMEYIASALQHRNQFPEQMREQTAEPDERPIRRYTLRPDANVKDYQTGHSHGGLDGIWKGQIDDLLQASLSMRIPLRSDTAANPSAGSSEGVEDTPVPLAPMK